MAAHSLLLLLVAVANGVEAALLQPRPRPAQASGLEGRRAFLRTGFAALASTPFLSPLRPASALEALSFDDLPKNSKSAYDQYWRALQLAADYYVFELKDQVADPQSWDLIGSLLEGKSIGSAQSPSRLEREFISPMRIMALAFPPDAGGEEMQVALDGFQRSMFDLGKVARSSPGGLETPDQTIIAKAVAQWESGRGHLNSFIEALNTVTSTDALKTIPDASGSYPRSKKLYTQLRKDAALCQNRGGEALAGIWGNLMVYGTVPGVNPCGNTDMAAYFAQ